jgi:RHS repeat-associated protein
MEKDDEVKGNGNHLDFGARAYDSRLGRFMSMDAHANSYPSLTQYNFVSNKPITHVDPDGNDNVIYLLVLQSADEKLTLSDKEDIVNQTNAMYKKLGVSTRVVLFNETESFSPKFIDDNDSYVLLGSPSERKRMMSKQGFQKGDIDWVGSVDNPERSTQLYGKGPFQGINIEFGVMGVFSKKYFKLTRNTGIAFTIVHGSTHNSGMGHTDPVAVGVMLDVASLAGKLNPGSPLFSKGIPLNDKNQAVRVHNPALTLDEVLEENNNSANYDYKTSFKKRNIETFGRGIGEHGALARDNYFFNKRIFEGIILNNIDFYNIPLRNPKTVDQANSKGGGNKKEPQKSRTKL